MNDELERLRTARAVLTHLTMLIPPASAEELHALAVYYGPVEALNTLTSAKESDEIRQHCLDGMTAEHLRAHIAYVSETTLEADSRVLIPEDADWPARLDDLSRVEYAAAPSSTYCLWVRGARGPIPASTVTICGGSAATPYGNAVAADLSQGMAGAGWTVAAASGFGIPQAAVRGALARGGRVVVVLPGGLDHPHPGTLRSLLTEVTRNGLVVSAYPPGTEPTRQRAAAAQRLLAGLSSGTVLVEAGLRSNSLAALKEAVARGRRAMAVPGPVTSAESAGTHQLMRECRPVRLVRHADDVLAELAHIR